MDKEAIPAKCYEILQGVDSTTINVFRKTPAQYAANYILVIALLMLPGLLLLTRLPKAIGTVDIVFIVMFMFLICAHFTLPVANYKTTTLMVVLPVAGLMVTLRKIVDAVDLTSISLCIFLFCMYFVVRKYYINIPRIACVVVSKGGIVMNKRIYKFNDIHNIRTKDYSYGSNLNSYAILFTHGTGDVTVFNLMTQTECGIIYSELCNVIRSYK